MKQHGEEAFEVAIVEHLVLHGGYTQGDSADYDRDQALLPKDLMAFTAETQPKPWEKVQQLHGDKTEQLFLDALVKEMSQQGSLSVLRHGFKFYGQSFRLAYFKPAHGLNPEIEKLYAANRLTAVRQLYYDPNNENSLDLVLFVNGVPVVTAELKNHMTGQTIKHARKQYRTDRDPKAPIFRFKERALVHFAVDPDEVEMTTRLSGAKTRFLPFNQGHGTAAGNPAVEGKHRTRYLWEDIWQRDSLLDLIGRFIHLQVEEKVNFQGKKYKTETMIFPRYHQRDCVNQLVDAARSAGSGSNYLVQHSAGSGKSNTIAWLAHRLASLHDDQDQKIYHAVVVLTDRRVLDQQLQDTIYQFDHKQGVVEKIDKHSEQLAQALKSGAPIIISTIHKFGFIQDKIADLPDRSYAIIVDEAHSSQSGEMAVNVKAILSAGQIDSRVAEDVEEYHCEPDTLDQLALRAAIARGQQQNLSFFAFTATPKYKTLALFGHKDTDGNVVPFHLYSMRQAIQEGFILDVLKGYIQYNRYYELVKKIGQDPELDKRKAARKLARFVNFHETNVSQKTEVMVEHFRHSVRHLLDGRAKAMVLSDSRLAAVTYKQAFDKYIAEKGYSDVRCLVAFSGEVKDDLGQTYTESQMNDGISQTELPERFAGPDFNVLLVANKYQTGFDQPLLCATYVDKRLSGILAVQALSRLNRMYSGKQTFVLDFRNEPEDIQAAFQQFYEDARIEEEVDPQRLYELKNQVEVFQLYEPTEVDNFCEIFFKLAGEVSISDHAQLNAYLDPAVDRFRELESDEQKEEFRVSLIAFCNLYGFLAQTVPFHDPDLEKLYAFGRMLLRKLPRPDGSGPMHLDDDDVALKYFILRRQAEADLGLHGGDGDPTPGPTATGTGAADIPKDLLSTIIELINAKFATEFDAQDLVDGVTQQLVADEEVQQAATANDMANFKYMFDEKLTAALMDRHTKHADFINAVFEDEAVGGLFRLMMLRAIYKELAG